MHFGLRITNQNSVTSDTVLCHEWHRTLCRVTMNSVTSNSDCIARHTELPMRDTPNCLARHTLVRRERCTEMRTQSEIYRRGNIENDWNSSVVRRSPSKAIIGFPIISDYFQCRKCRFPDVGPRRICRGFCALKSPEFRLKHALRNFLSMYFH